MKRNYFIESRVSGDLKKYSEQINEKYKDKNLKATENFKFVIITDCIFR